MSEAPEEYHVTIDFQNENPDLTQPYKLIGLETSHPVLRIDRQVYVGTWATNIGTEMMFDEKGEWVMNVEKRLMMEKVEVVRRDEQVENPGRPKLLRVEDLQDSAAEGQRRNFESNLAPEIMRQTSVLEENAALPNNIPQLEDDSFINNEISNDSDIDDAMDTT